MITLKFPPLDKALLKPSQLKDADVDDPRRGIIVINNCAIVIQDDFCLVINLFEYFTVECGIEDDEEIAELKRILFYMDRKVFNTGYWKELTKGANMKMQNGLLFIENPKYAKDLHYTDFVVDFLEPLACLKMAAELKENLISAISIPYGALKTIYDCLAPEFKTDNIIFEFASQDKQVKFTFRKRKHVFGYLFPHYDSVQEGFRFHNYDEFIYDDVVLELIEELQAKVPPPPPTQEEDDLNDNVEESSGDPKLNFEDGNEQ